MFWSWGWGQEPMVPSVDKNNQSISVDGKPYHRTSHLSKGDDLLDTEKMSDCRLCYDVLHVGKQQSGNGPCLGTRTGPNKEYEWMPYQQVIDKVHEFGSGLVHAGNDPGKNKFVAIFSQNRPEWTIADFGCQAYSMVPVALYETLGLQACKHILNECEIATVICDKLKKVEMILDLQEDVPSLHMIVVMETITDTVRSAVKSVGLKVVQYEDVLLPSEDDIFTMCYTSGTTGNPKGVVVTHIAFVRTVESIHIVLKILLMMRGVRIGYSSGDVKLLMNDLAALRPTFFPSVPRLLNRIYDSVQADVQSSFIKSTLLSWALASKKKEIDNHIFRRDSLWDRLIFHKIQDKLGGRVKLVISGAAPLSADVMSFLRCALGCIVLEGYGQTEAIAGLSLTLPGDNTLGHVGPPLPGIHIKLVDVPEMNFYAKDGIGEIVAKGNYMMKGYYRQPEKTAETLDEDGWLHTEDIGTWQENGTLKIVDRKKNVFKLSQGEYVATEKIENIYRSSPFVGQIFVDGDSMKPYLMAVVVPDDVFLKTWAPNNGYPSTLKEFCKAEGAKNLVLEDMIREGKKAEMMNFEQVKDIYLESDMFSIENELLTPTMKNKRVALRKKYADTVQQLYKDNGL